MERESQRNPSMWHNMMMMPSISFQRFFLYRHLKLSYTLENSVSYYYTSYEMTDQFLWFQLQMNSYSSNWNTPSKAWLSQLVNFKNAIWTWGHFRRTICNKILFKLGKMPLKRMECFRLLFDHLAWIEHEFLSGIRDSRKAGSLWGMMRGVGGVWKSVHQSWLAKGLGLRLLCWGFKGVQEEIPWKDASTLQIGSVAFPPGQYTSPQLHPCHRLFDQDGHQDSSPPSL